MALNKNKINKKPVRVVEVNQQLDYEKQAELLQKERFDKGSAKSFLIKEHASKISNIPLIINIGSSTEEKIKKDLKIIRKLKYALPEHGICALVKDEKTNKIDVAKVIKHNFFGTDTLYELDIHISDIQDEDKTNYQIIKKYRIDPNKKDKSSFIVEVIGVSTSGTEISVDKINEIIGREIFDSIQELKTSFIPATIILNNELGESEIENFEELFDLERKLFMELSKDLDLSRKKIIYKTKLTRKSKEQIVVEMYKSSIIVFEDSDAIFASPIDLWNPQLNSESIYKTIDWVFNYMVKASFSSRDSMQSKTNKHTTEIKNMDQGPLSYLEDKLTSWSDNITDFLNMFSDGIEIKLQSAEVILEQKNIKKEEESNDKKNKTEEV